MREESQAAVSMDVYEAAAAADAQSAATSC